MRRNWTVRSRPWDGSGTRSRDPRSADGSWARRVSRAPLTCRIPVRTASAFRGDGAGIAREADWLHRPAGRRFVERSIGATWRRAGSAADRLQAPAPSHQLARQPVEEFRMSGPGTVFFRNRWVFIHPTLEMMLPQPVDDHPRGERIARRSPVGVGDFFPAHRRPGKPVETARAWPEGPPPASASDLPGTVGGSAAAA